METLILMFDTAAILVVVIFSLRNEKLPPDAPETGPFRLRPRRDPAPPPGTAAKRPRRTRGL